MECILENQASQKISDNKSNNIRYFSKISKNVTSYLLDLFDIYELSSIVTLNRQFSTRIIQKLSDPFSFREINPDSQNFSQLIKILTLAHKEPNFTGNTGL